MAVARVDTSGPRPVIDYLTKDYEGFRQAMLDQIPLRLPQWTDRSESDFGVVLIELFAYVADILSYYQDRVANEAYLATRHPAALGDRAAAADRLPDRPGAGGDCPPAPRRERRCRRLGARACRTRSRPPAARARRT